MESAAGILGLAQGSALIDDRAETQLTGILTPHLGSGFASVSARWDRGRGFYTTPADQRVPASARASFDSYSVGLRGAAPLSEDIELQARGLGFADHRTLRFEGADSSSSGQDASVRLIGRGRWQFDVLAYVQARNFSNIVVSSTRFVPVLDQRNTPSTGIGGKIELRPPTGNANTLRIGSDWRISQGQLFEDAISAFSGKITARRNAGGRNGDVGFYLEDDLVLGRLTLTGGARVDRWSIADGFFRERNAAQQLIIDNSYTDRSGWEGSFRAGALFDMGGGLAVRGAAYTGFRVPTLNELYRPFVVFPVTTQANEALDNEHLRGAEIGFDFALSPQTRLSVTAFTNELRDAIANVTIGPDLRQRRNIDAVRSRGIEATGRAQMGKFQFLGSAAYTDARVRGRGAAAALDGFRPAQTPKFSASGTVAVQPSERFTLSATVRHIGAQFEDDRNSDVLPAATTVDLFAELGLMEGVSLLLRGENMFDETIVTRNQGGSIDLGVPRTLWIGLRAGFGR